MPISKNRKIAHIVYETKDGIVIDRKGRKSYRSDKRKQGNKGTPKWVYPEIPKHPTPGYPNVTAN